MENRNLSSLDLSDRKHKKKRAGKDSFAHFLLFYIVPFLLINAVIFVLVTAQPDFTVTVTDEADHLSADVTIRKTSRFPLRSFSAALEGEPLEMEQDEEKVYHSTVTNNGTLEVIMVNFNGMTKTVYEAINSIDDAPPLITEGIINSGYVEMYVDDTQSGVDFNSIYGIEADGSRVTPSEINEGEGRIAFLFSTTSLEVHVADKAGKESIATFTSTVIEADQP